MNTPAPPWRKSRDRPTPQAQVAERTMAYYTREALKNIDMKPVEQINGWLGEVELMRPEYIHRLDCTSNKHHLFSDE